MIIGSRFWKSFFYGRAIRLLVHVTKRFGQCCDSVFECEVWCCCVIISVNKWFIIQSLNRLTTTKPCRNGKKHVSVIKSRRMFIRELVILKHLSVNKVFPWCVVDADPSKLQRNLVLLREK